MCDVHWAYVFSSPSEGGSVVALKLLARRRATQAWPSKRKERRSNAQLWRGMWADTRHCPRR